MGTIKEMTPTEFTNLLNEYFAPPDKRSKMSIEEIQDLAARLNQKINVPLISETGEEQILIKVILQVDRFLYDNLPNEVYDLARSMDRGISKKEARRLARRLSRLANDKIDIPYLPEQAEYVAIRFVIGIIINAAREAWDMDKAKAKAGVVNLPDSKDASDDELDAMVLDE